jgi:type I restriction enzyme S subunit
MVDSELGLIPDGWEIKPIGSTIEITGGGTPSTKVMEYWKNGSINWFTPSDLTSKGTMFITDSEKKISPLGLQKSSAKLFPAYSVMMTSRATLGVLSINTKESCTNQGFITCIPNEQLSVFQIYYWIQENKEQIIGLGHGSTYPEIIKSIFRQLPIIIPEKNLSIMFKEKITPICKLIENLQSQNDDLKQTRDFLLPRLISGEIDVSDLDIAIPESEDGDTIVAGVS